MYMHDILSLPCSRSRTVEVMKRLKTLPKTSVSKNDDIDLEVFHAKMTIACKEHTVLLI